MEVSEEEVAHRSGSVLARMFALATGTAALGTAGPITSLAAQAASSAVLPRMNLLVGDMKVMTSLE